MERPAAKAAMAMSNMIVKMTMEHCVTPLGSFQDISSYVSNKDISLSQSARKGDGEHFPECPVWASC
jgi:hypothetical protein